MLFKIQEDLLEVKLIYILSTLIFIAYKLRLSFQEMSSIMNNSAPSRISNSSQGLEHLWRSR